jgi:hypothetical protein
LIKHDINEFGGGAVGVAANVMGRSMPACSTASSVSAFAQVRKMLCMAARLGLGGRPGDGRLGAGRGWGSGRPLVEISMYYEKI